MFKYDLSVVESNCLRCFHVFLVPDSKDSRSCNPDKLGNARNSNRKHQIPDTLSKYGNNNDRHKHIRNRSENIGTAHDQFFQPASEETCDSSQCYTNDKADRYSNQAY